MVKVEKHADRKIAVVTLSRANKLNPLCDALIIELQTKLEELDGDADVRCIVLTGSEKVGRGYYWRLLAGKGGTRRRWSAVCGE